MVRLAHVRSLFLGRNRGCTMGTVQALRTFYRCSAQQKGLRCRLRTQCFAGKNTTWLKANAVATAPGVEFLTGHAQASSLAFLLLFYFVAPESFLQRVEQNSSLQEGVTHLATARKQQRKKPNSDSGFGCIGPLLFCSYEMAEEPVHRAAERGGGAGAAAGRRKMIKTQTKEKDSFGTYGAISLLGICPRVFRL